MKLSSTAFSNNSRIPGEFAFGVMDQAKHVALSDNRNPPLKWTDVPAGTRSFALCCIDTDVPTRPDDVNQEGRSVPADLPRTEFVHWLIADIPASFRGFTAGSCSDGITAGGKRAPSGPADSVQGVNDYTSWFANDPDMTGTYLGYDGPCPPWNDSLVHHYHFTLYALDRDSLGLASGFSLNELRQALLGRVLAQASLTGTYSLNPALADA